MVLQVPVLASEEWPLNFVRVSIEAELPDLGWRDKWGVHHVAVVFKTEEPPLKQVGHVRRKSQTILPVQAFVRICTRSPWFHVYYVQKSRIRNARQTTARLDPKDTCSELPLTTAGFDYLKFCRRFHRGHRVQLFLERVVKIVRIFPENRRHFVWRHTCVGRRQGRFLKFHQGSGERNIGAARGRFGAGLESFLREDNPAVRAQIVDDGFQRHYFFFSDSSSQKLAFDDPRAFDTV